MTRAQVSMEFLMVMSIIFLMIMPLIIIFLTQSNDIQQQIVTTQANKVITKIRDTADQVYLAGYPTKKTFTVYLPDRIQSINFFQNYLNLTFESGLLDKNIIISSMANLTGNLTAYNGVHVIKVEALPSSALPNQVAITDEPE